MDFERSWSGVELQARGGKKQGGVERGEAMTSYTVAGAGKVIPLPYPVSPRPGAHGREPAGSPDW